MPSSPALVYYWDACVFLSYLEGHPDRAPHIQSLLTSAEAREIRILTSTLSVVEVAFGAREKLKRELSREEEDRIDALWRGPVELVDFHYLVALEARELMRRSLVLECPTLKAADAVHLASAKRMGATRVHTYDGPMKETGRALGVEVGPPKAEQIEILLGEAQEAVQGKPSDEPSAEGAVESARRTDSEGSGVGASPEANAGGATPVIREDGGLPPPEPPPTEAPATEQG